MLYLPETVAGQEPVLGYPSLAQLLRRAGVAEDGLNLLDMQELFRRMVFNGIRRDFPLPGDGIKCQDWVVKFNLKP